MDFLEFELLTKKILEKRLFESLGTSIVLDHSKLFTSVSGNQYEVDLSYVIRIGGLDYLTIVECKSWNSHVGRDKVGYLDSVANDINAQKL